MLKGKNFKEEVQNGAADFGKKAGKFAGIALAVAIALLLAITSVYSVTEQQQAVVTMFGKVQEVKNAGMYFRIPFIQRVRKVDTTTHGTGLGYIVTNDGQNITDEANGIMITSDFNLVNIDFYMEYKVSDPVAYLYNSNDPEEIMVNMARAAIRSTVINYPVDEVITTGKSQIQADVKEKLSKSLSDNTIGLQVVNITVQDAEPPTREIVAAFKAVETAKQSKDTAINNANQYKNEQIPAAEAEADRITQQAEATKQARIAEAEGQAERFNKMYEEYQKYPLITKRRLFYETMEELLPEMKVIITDGNTQELLPIDSFSQGGTGNEES